MGDRIATIMAYISDVQAGGFTAFPMLGLSMKPEKGSAVFWMNVIPIGHRQRLSLHGGCPVAIGSKWITNKWIKYYDQFKKYPCGLKPTNSYDLRTRFSKQR